MDHKRNCLYCGEVYMPSIDFDISCKKCRSNKKRRSWNKNSSKNFVEAMFKNRERKNTMEGI